MDMDPQLCSAGYLLGYNSVYKVGFMDELLSPQTLPTIV